MMCQCCGQPVHCRDCGVRVQSQQARWSKQRATQGKCPRCGAKKTAKDGPHVDCFDCRRRNAERNRQRYATHGRKDRRQKGVAA